MAVTGPGCGRVSIYLYVFLNYIWSFWKHTASSSRFMPETIEAYHDGMSFCPRVVYLVRANSGTWGILSIRIQRKTIIAISYKRWSVTRRICLVFLVFLELMLSFFCISVFDVKTYFFFVFFICKTIILCVFSTFISLLSLWCSTMFSYKIGVSVC